MEFKPFEAFIAFLLVVFVRADLNPDSKCVEYNTESFAENVNKNDHFVMFYAPWCVHCKKLHPTWDELAELLNDGEGSRVTVARVDCTKETTICKEQDITGYPTLKYFSTEKLEPVKFKGIRDLPSLTNFVNIQLGSSLVMPGKIEEEPSGAAPLTDENYQARLSSGKHFVKFYAPWCGHCQRLAPIWDALGASFESSKDITISKIDCTINREACNDYEIKSYPTLLMIENGQLIGKFQGQKTLFNLKEYIKNHLGESDDNLEVEYNPKLASPVQSLTGIANFQNAISNGFTFVKFYAPWCGHCKGLAPTWEDLGKKFLGKSNLAIAKVDCTLDDNKDLCNEQNIDGFPTLHLYKNGEKVEEYTGARSLEELTEFVIRHLDHHEHEHVEL